MARRRMIDPNIWGSEDMSKLTIRQRMLVIGLFSNADDHGKGIAKPPYIRSMVFPYDDIPITDIVHDLEVIKADISIRFYEVEGNSYYKFYNWLKWQRVDKPQPSIIPEPVENDSGITPEPLSPKGKEVKGSEVEEKLREEEEKDAASADPYIQVINEFCKIHGKLDIHLKTQERTDAHTLLDSGIPADYIVTTIKKIYKQRTDKGEKITSLSYYTNAITEAWKGELENESHKGLRSDGNAGKDQGTPELVGWLPSKYNTHDKVVHLPKVSG